MCGLDIHAKRLLKYKPHMSNDKNKVAQETPQPQPVTPTVITTTATTKATHIPSASAAFLKRDVQARERKQPAPNRHEVNPAEYLLVALKQ